jgi:hypothetical protein
MRGGLRPSQKAHAQVATARVHSARAARWGRQLQPLRTRGVHGDVIPGADSSRPDDAPNWTALSSVRSNTGRSEVAWESSPPPHMRQPSAQRARSVGSGLRSCSSRCGHMGRKGPRTQPVRPTTLGGAVPMMNRSIASLTASVPAVSRLPPCHCRHEACPRVGDRIMGNQGRGARPKCRTFLRMFRWAVGPAAAFFDKYLLQKETIILTGCWSDSY